MIHIGKDHHGEPLQVYEEDGALIVESSAADKFEMVLTLNEASLLASLFVNAAERGLNVIMRDQTAKHRDRAGHA